MTTRATAIDRTIHAAAAEVGVVPGTLREWERLGLLIPRRDSVGRPLYGDAEITAGRAIRNKRRATQGSGLSNRVPVAP
jgi:DNA-binding transcriptional MerR regulator